MPHCPKTVRVKRSRCYVTADGQDLNFATLGVGETTAGTLVFDMPSLHGRIAYAPNLDGQALGYWKC
jgi:hypothetical protein